MKRKWFTLLFAFMALASFQVFAQIKTPYPVPVPACPAGQYWIRVDTSGLTGTDQWGADLPYSANKQILPQWLVYTGGVTKDSAAVNWNSVITQDGDISQWTITTNTQGGYTFLSTKDGALPLKLSSGGNSFTGFEVVQFKGNPANLAGTGGTQPADGYSWGWKRTVQSIVNGTMEGYLMPAQGGTGDIRRDTTANMTMVVADNARHLSIQKFSDVMTRIYDGPVFIAGQNYVTTGYPTYNYGTNAQLDIRAALLNGLVQNGPSGTQAVLKRGTVTGGYTRAVVYLTKAYLDAFGATNPLPLVNGDAFVDPSYTTWYKGTKTNEQEAYDDVANWTNGQPADFGLATAVMDYPGVTPIGKVFVMIVQQQPLDKPAVTGQKAQDLIGIATNVEANGTVLLHNFVYTSTAIAKGWRPVYIRIETPSGRWATPDDFGPGAYNFPGLNVASAKDVKDKNKNANVQETFNVTYVDWVAQATAVDGVRPATQSGGNMFGNTGDEAAAGYYTTKFNNAAGGKATGLEMGVELPDGQVDNIIPLFTLSSPVNCDVVSVSRENGLTIQSEAPGVTANQLELRPYGVYYDWFHYKDGAAVWTAHKAGDAVDNPSGLWDAHYGTDQAGKPALSDVRVATSLQKFAIWIDVCGNMTLYPAASYSWIYGQDKDKKTQVSTVSPNSVLLYNNPKITAAPSVAADADKSWGTQVGQWNGRNTNTADNVGWQTVTAPNKIETNSDYLPLQFAKDLAGANNKAIEGKWFFLEVDAASTGVDLMKGKDGASAGKFDKGAFGTNGIQDANGNKTAYVLSVQVNGDGTKKLVMVPKEKVRRYDDATGNLWYNDLLAYKKIEGGQLLPEYWTQNPYDMVNMAAHWAIVNKGTADAPKYLIYNMLGDTLQYNAPIADSANPGQFIPSSLLAGGFLPVNSQIAADGIYNGSYNNTSKWFGKNLTTGGSNLWSATAVPGAAPGDVGFVLNLGKNSLAFASGWYKGPTVARNEINGAYDSLYWQRDLALITPAIPALPVAVDKWTCPNSLVFKKVPIYYVPNYSRSYDNETNDAPATPSLVAETINTSDVNFGDLAGNMVQDSLTAYLYLNGYYGIKEAYAVNNKLLLGDTIVEWHNTNVAALTDQGDLDIQFIPVGATDRAAHIKAIRNQADNQNDLLYGETYKWFVVMKGDKYLVFDTIAPGNTVDQYKYGFTFQSTDIANATPVRLYQPLVGDKLQGNFIFEFQIPEFTYVVTAYNTDGSVKTGYVLENQNPYKIQFKPGVAGTGTQATNGTRVFGKLYKQSNYINAVKNYNEATRFTYTFVGAGEPCCPEEFIKPDWMAKEKLLSLPLKNQVWSLTKGLGWNFVNGGVNKNEAILEKTNTELTFTLVDSIKNGVYEYTYMDGNTKKAQTVGGFYSDLIVPLYYITQTKGTDVYYLTVSDTTYKFDSRSTAKDVMGVNLIWTKEKYATNTGVDKDHLNKQALQLFAISGNQGKPDPNGWYTDCQSYVYLPLASYKAVYKTGTVDKTQIYYNKGLGKKGKPNCFTPNNQVNDVTEAFRVGYYSGLYDDIQAQKNLAVMNASGASMDASLASMEPVAEKWHKLDYDIIGCQSQLVYNEGKGTTAQNQNFYYASGGAGYEKLCNANSNTLLAHWSIIHGNEVEGVENGDPQLHFFQPEAVIAVPGYKEADLNGKNTMLKGNYYFKILSTSADGKTTEVRVFDFSNYNSSTNFSIGYDTFKITCIDHTLPYMNLETDGGYELPAQLAGVESKFFDRNITDRTTYAPVQGPTRLVTKDNVLSYFVYLNQETDVDKDVYMKAYKTNIRRLGEELNEDGTGHDIPYYAFSIIGADKKEYFLTVNDNTRNGQDSLYWTLLTPAQVQQIKDDYAEGVPNAGSNALSRNKFCLPFEVDANGVPMQRHNKYDGQDYWSVYIMSMDTSITDRPYFATVGSPSWSGTVVQASPDVFDQKGACGATVSSVTKNVYSMDFLQVNPNKVTTWAFVGSKPSQTEWVPLHNLAGQSPYTNPELGTKELSTDGLLTSFQKQTGGGITFITESKEKPVNYGILSGLTNGLLHFEYEGTELIGKYEKVPIYYYRIQIPGQANKWLTDSKDSTGAYIYTWGPTATTQSNWNYAFFGSKLSKNVIKDKPYNADFVQTFGLRYVNATVEPTVVADDRIADKTFVVVANANYTNPNPAEYRYLSAANGRLTFVKDVTNAMAFQFGRENENGGFTGIQTVGTSEVYGVTGGVRLLNQAGAVSLYSVDGSLLKTVQVTGSDQTIDAPRGIVIVKSLGKVTKVVVK